MMFHLNVQGDNDDV